MASTTTHLIELIINATNNAGAGFAAARRDAQKFNDLINQGEKDTDRSAEAQDRLQKAIEVSNKKMKEENDSLGENIRLTEKDAAAKATLTSAIKNQAAEIASDEATKDSLFLADQRRDEAEDALAESRRKRRATEIRSEEAFVNKFGVLGSRKKIQALKADSETAAIEVFALHRRRDIRNEEIKAERQHVTTLNDLVKKAESGNFRGANGARTKFQELRPALNEAGFTNIDVSGSDQTFLRTLRNARKSAVGRVTRAKTGTLPGLAEDTSQDAIDAAIGKRQKEQRKTNVNLKKAEGSRTRDTVDEARFIDKIIAKEEKRAALEIDRFAREQEHQALLVEGERLLEGFDRKKDERAAQRAKDGSKIQGLLRDEENDRKRILDQIEKLTVASAKYGALTSRANKDLRTQISLLRQEYIELGNNEERAIRRREVFDLIQMTSQKARAEDMTADLERQEKEKSKMHEKAIALDEERTSKLEKEQAKQIDLGEKLTSELAKEEAKRAAAAEEAPEKSFQKAQQLRAREDRFITDRRRLLIDKGGEEPAPELKAKLVVDRLEINRLKEELRAELRDLEARVKIDADPLSIAKIQAIKTILGKDIDVDFDVDTTSLSELLSGGWQAFTQGAQKASKSVSSFDNVFRGLLVLGIVAFLGQLATGIILAASALTALVSSAISAAGALGGALVAGIGQALPAIGVLAAFGNRVSNVFDALKQSNLEQQQASYSGADAADTQAKSLSGVADAQKALTEARKAAKKALEDLIFAEKGQALSVEEAGIALNKAVSSGGSLAVSRAQLGVEGANRDLAGTRSEISSRKKGGIEGSPEVVAAQKALDQALQSANQGTASVGAAAGKLNYLVEGLSKAEQRLLKALIRLQAAWREFAENITEPLTNSFTFAVNKVIKILDSKQILNAGKRLSTALGASFTQIFDALFSKNTVSRFLALGTEFAKNLKPITSIAIGLLNIFLSFAEAGGPALSLILGYINDIVGSLDKWSSSIAGKKSLTDFFTEGSGSLKGVLDLLMSIGNVILAIMGPAGGIKAGNTIIDQMTGALNKFAEAIKDPTSRVGIFFKNFFDQGIKLLPTLGPVFSALGKLVETLISPTAIKAFENFADIVANAVIPGLEEFIKQSTKVFNAFSFLARSSIGEFLIKWGIAGALIGGVGSKIKAVAGPFTGLIGYLKTATGQLDLFNKSLKTTNALTDATTNPNLITGRGAAKKSLQEGKSIAVDAGPGSATGAEYGAALAADEAFDAARGASQRKSQKARDKALGKLGSGREDDVDKARKQANKIDKIGDKAGLASAGSLLTKLANPAGLVLIAVTAIAAVILGLIAYSGRLGDVWKQIKKTFNEIFAAIKKGAGEIAKEITGKGSIKEAFQDISKFAKKVGNALADAGIFLTKAFGKTAVKIIEDLVKVIIGVIKAVKFTIQAFKDVKSWTKEAGTNIGNFFNNILSAIVQAAEGAVNTVIGAVKKIADTFNGLPAWARLGKTIDVSGLQPVNFESPNEKKAREAATARSDRRQDQQQRDMRDARGGGDQPAKRADQPEASGKQRRTPGKDKSPAKAKAATKADNADANAFLNTFDPQTVQLSDAIVKKLSSYWRTLRRAARDSVNDVIDFLKDLRGAQGNGRVDKFVTLAVSDFKRLRTGVRVNMTGISNIVKNQMQNSMKAVHDAAVYMKRTLNDALKAVGADGDLIKLTVGAPPKVTGEPQKAASGGWIGNRGERGKDEVHTILGRGEAVLNWGQQKVVEPALRQVYGFGLDEMFGRTRGLHAGTGNVMGGRASGGRGKLFTQGKASWFGGPNDGMNVGTATGVPDTTPGIALYSAATKNKYFNVYAPNGRWHKERQIDFGPAPWTGKVLDITSAALKHFGFNEKNFPTGVGNWKVYGPVGGSGSQGGGGAEALKMPKITGADSPMGQFVSKGTKKMIDGAQKYLDKKTPSSDGGAYATQSGSGGPAGLGNFDGFQVAKWIIPILTWARKHGWKGSLTSGYRSHAYNVAQGRNYHSNHEDTVYPGGAIDVGGYGAVAEGQALANVLKGYRGPRNLVWGSAIKDYGHFSARGNAAGGFVGLKKYAHGGMVNGKDGQEVPIVAHAGEWVVNKMQQAKLAMMAGTTPDRVKGALGFGGGPTSFADGGVVKELNTTRLQGLAENIPAGINGFTTKISQAFNQAFSFIDKQINKTLGKVSSKNFSKNLETMLSSIRKLTGETGALDTIAGQITTFFEKATSSAKLLAAGFQAAGNKLKRVTTGEKFENAINPVKIAEAEAKLQEELQNRLLLLREEWVRTLARINKLIKKNKLGSSASIQAQADKIQADIDKLEKDDEDAGEKKKIKKLEKRLAENKKRLDARKKLDAEKNTAQDKIKGIEDQISESETSRIEALKTAFQETTKADTKTSDATIKQSTYLKSVGELLSSFGGSLFGQTGQDLVTKSLADNKQAAIGRQTALNKRLSDAQALAAADPRFQSLVDELADQVNEANLAVLQATADVGANAISALQKGVEDKIKAIDTGSALNNIKKSIGELIGDNGAVSSALDENLSNANKRKDALDAALREAKINSAANPDDPRWKELVTSLNQQLEEAGLSVLEANAAIIQNAVDATEKVFQRGEFLRGISERAAALDERIGNRSGAFATRQGNLAGRGADLQSQRDSLQALLSNPAIAGNGKQIEELGNKIKELDASIAENSQDLKDLSLEYRKSQVDLITGRSDRTTGLIGSVGGIIANIARATGSSQSLESQIGLAQQIKTALGLEQGGLADQISKAIADQQLGSEANAVLAQLQAAFSSGDPSSFAATLAALSPTISELESTLGVTAAGTFQSLINAMITNTTATTDNTANLAELNGLANQPQQFATTAWTKFRTALFNGVGDILPQFQIPQMATGGAITKGGLFQLHPGEFVVNATQSNLPSDSPINITVNEANKPLDVTALASRIAFEKRTRR